MLNDELPRVRAAVKEATGISIPGVTVGTEPGFEPGGYRILHEETEVRVGTVAGEEDPYGAIGAALEDELRPLAWRFFDVDEAAKLLTELEHAEDVSKHELARRVIRRDRTAAVILVSGVVQALLQDGVKAELATVLEVVAARSSHDSVGVLTERARFALGVRSREAPIRADLWRSTRRTRWTSRDGSSGSTESVPWRSTKGSFRAWSTAWPSTWTDTRSPRRSSCACRAFAPTSRRS